MNPQIFIQSYTAIKNQKKDILFIAKDKLEADNLYKFLSFLAPNTFILNDTDRNLYSQNSASSKNSNQRATALGKIINCSENKVVVISAQSFFQRLPSPEYFINSIDLKPGLEITPELLAKRLIENGFVRMEVARSIGEFAQRGDILDIMNHEHKGYRLYFDYSNLTKIKTFDSYTQRSIQDEDHITIFPLSDLVLNQLSIECFIKKFNNKLTLSNDLLNYNSILKGVYFNGIENIWPFFFESTGSIIEFLSDDYQVFYNFDLTQNYQEFLENTKKSLDKLKALTDLYAPINKVLLDSIYITKIEDKYKSLAKSVDNLLDLVPNFYFQAKHQSFRAKELLEQFIRFRLNKQLIILSVGDFNNLDNIKQFFDENKLPYKDISSYNQAQQKLVNLYHKQIPSIYLKDIVIIQDSQVYGNKSQKERPKSNTNLKQYVFELNNFESGEIVVHKDYGIAKFCGVEAITIEKLLRDYVKLLYAEDDKIYIPVENIDLIKKFGEGEPRLDKLGTAYWQKRKANLKNKISDLAHELINSAAQRSLVLEKPLLINKESYQNFCKAFPYIETPDQEAAISDIMDDFIQGKIVDRLICGDVGYGKTEVAMRATFFILDGNKKAQVAIISPTTVLSRQHFIDFEERFKSFGFNVAQISRFTSKNEQKKIKEQIKKGEIDIVIGTHALLSKNIEFSNLMLAIIDEEHQFGVKQKEILKLLKQSCHVVSLSATPIPRTLQMSLVGVKDLSIIATPPFERTYVKTFIIEKNLQVLKEIINSEVERGGQIFYVVPRIESLYKNYEMLSNLEPNLKIGIVHSKIAPEELDMTLQKFYEKDYNLLLSTNIIQSGLDIPNANTIIIDDAHLFGLSQLYQLRGRVGRGSVQGYSYFICKESQTDKLAYRRLQIIQANQELGSGFNIASYDMELRGYGNLLGDQQSGVIREVGIELYQDMLKEAVSNIKNAKQSKNENNPEEENTPKLNLNISIHIPESYISDSNLRLLTYRRMASISSKEECQDFIEELNDRFGQIPVEVGNLLSIIQIKSICKSMKISSLDVGPNGFVIQFALPTILPKVIEIVNYNSKQMKLKSNGSLIILKKQDSKSDEQKLNYIFNMLEKLKLQLR